MKRLALLAILLGSPALTEEFVPMTGADVLDALTGSTLLYDSGSWQDFRASGRTLYNAGQDSWGYWAVRDDQYCSQWPPSDMWACYDMARAGDVIRFIGQAGDTTDGRFKD
ncbi:MAG: hypothetical protein AAF754_08600 [Pseudomonadota bacterium]